MTICCHFNISLNEDHDMHHYQKHISHAVFILTGHDEFLVVLLWHNTSLSPGHYLKNTSLGGLVKLCLTTYYHSQIAGNAISEVLDFMRDPWHATVCRWNLFCQIRTNTCEIFAKLICNFRWKINTRKLKGRKIHLKY